MQSIRYRIPKSQKSGAFPPVYGGLSMGEEHAVEDISSLIIREAFSVVAQKWFFRPVTNSRPCIC